MTRPSQDLPNRLRERREQLGLTLRDVANRLGGAVNTSMVSKYELGDRSPTLEWLRRFARALETDVASLLIEKDNPWALTEKERLMVQEIRRSTKQTAALIVAIVEAIEA